MATGRTVSASFLTDKDKNVLLLCETISKQIEDSISNAKNKEEFKKEFGKISYSRDAGLGVGGGKLQRDAICTRGRQGKAPFSNRNLRWHPLVVAENPLKWAKEIEKIEVEGNGDASVLVFVIKGSNGKEIKVSADKIHELPERCVTLPKHWFPHIDTLKHWSDTLWTQNSCVIPALEACEWWDSVETYAVLGMAIAVEIYKANFGQLYIDIVKILKNQGIDKKISLPSKTFPTKKEDIVNCPLCKVSISQNPANLQDRTRQDVWQPAWRRTKRGEGEDSSTQIMHVNPLVENEIKHNASCVRYGHRWCNVAMTDHSLDETLDFMEYIVKIHERCK